MLRRNVRLRKEYLYKKALDDQDNAIKDRKRRIKKAIELGVVSHTNITCVVVYDIFQPLAPEDRHFESALRGKLELEDERSLTRTSAQDDEYAYAGEYISWFVSKYLSIKRTEGSSYSDNDMSRSF